MKKVKFLINVRPMPGCPKGRIFHLSADKTFYLHYISDEEVATGKFVNYSFTTKQLKQKSIRKFFATVYLPKHWLKLK